MSTAARADLVPLYGLTEEHLGFRDMIARMVRERVAPRAAEIDATGEFPEIQRVVIARTLR
jgi:hypothetical protein